VPPDEQEGRYSNHFKVGFNSFEFILDFGQAYEGVSVELHHTRLITTPAYTKALAKLLLDSVAAYEQAYGTIPDIAARDSSDA
jgi:Protein of unknown function (DUF3467)